MTVAIRVYVPANAEPHVRATVEQQLSMKHGGATTFDARGSWVNDDDRLETDDMLVIESVADSHDGIAERLATYVKSQTNEDAVMWEVRPVNEMGMA